MIPTMQDKTENLATLSGLLVNFASGKDQSRECVQQIDALLTDSFPNGDGFPDADAYEDLELAVACFRPGGGQFMYDEAQMASICASVLARLNPQDS